MTKIYGELYCLAEYMPDDCRAIEQDLFSRAALVWRIERQTKIRLSRREPRPVLEGSKLKRSEEKL